MSLTRTTWHGTAVKAKARVGAARGLYLGAEHVLEEANRLVPIEESTLLKSGHAWHPESAGYAGASGMQAAVTYDTPYAVRQHEDLSMQHDAGRQAKYLEQPINSEQHAVETLIAREIKAALGS